MTRAHRRWHRAAWIVVGPLAAAVLATALAARREVPAQEPPVIPSAAAELRPSSDGGSA